MAPMPVNFTGLFPPSKQRQVPPEAVLTYIIKDALSIPQWLCLGALFQTSLLYLLPSTRLALLPAFLFLLYTVTSTTYQILRPSSDPWLSSIMPGRVTSQFPNTSYSPSSPEKPLFGSTPASQQVIVFHIGVRYSHPLGPLAPGVNAFRKHLSAQYVTLAAAAKKYGYLGGSFWRGAENDRVNTGMSIMYFSSLEGLHAFGHDKVHKDAWEWYHSFVRQTGYKHLGIFHETFVVPKGQWETIYGNCPQILMAKTRVPVTNDETGEEEWVSPVVDGRTPQLMSKYGRMGMTRGGYQLDGKE